MKLADLKDGMVVVYRSGITRTVKQYAFIDENGERVSGKHRYNEDLTANRKMHIGNVSQCDIVKVLQNNEIIWERGI